MSRINQENLFDYSTGAFLAQRKGCVWGLRGLEVGCWHDKAR